MIVQEALKIISYEYSENDKKIKEFKGNNNEPTIILLQSFKAQATLYFYILEKHLKSAENPRGLATDQVMNIPLINDYINLIHRNKKSSAPMFWNIFKLDSDVEGQKYLKQAIERVKWKARGSHSVEKALSDLTIELKALKTPNARAASPRASLHPIEMSPVSSAASPATESAMPENTIKNIKEALSTLHQWIEDYFKKNPQASDKRDKYIQKKAYAFMYYMILNALEATLGPDTQVIKHKTSDATKLTFPALLDYVETLDVKEKHKKLFPGTARLDFFPKEKNERGRFYLNIVFEDLSSTVMFGDNYSVLIQNTVRNLKLYVASELNVFATSEKLNNNNQQDDQKAWFPLDSVSPCRRLLAFNLWEKYFQPKTDKAAESTNKASFDN